MERSMIIIGGELRAGRSTLTRNIAENLQQEHNTQYISFGDTVRAIGRQATLPDDIHDVYTTSYYSMIVKDHLESKDAHNMLDDDIARGIMDEELTRTDEADLLIVDGYPKNETQAQHLIDLAINDDRKVAGLLIATITEEEALARMLKRGRGDTPSTYGDKIALERLRQHSQAFGAAVLYLASKNIPIESIDTSSPKEITAEKGLAAIKLFLAQKA